MSFGKGLTFLSVLAAVLLAALFFSRSNDEDAPPSLESIVADLNSGDLRTRTYAKTRLLDLGTNALPKLLRMYGPPESLPSKSWWFGNNRRRPRISENKNRILVAFAVLGKDAAAAVPVLVQDLQVVGVYDSRIAHTLGAIGEPALEPVLSLLQTNNKMMVRRGCLTVVAAMGPAAERAIPILTNFLTSSDEWLSREAVSALGAIARQPETIVPILARQLTHTNEYLRSETALAIAKFGTNAAIALNELRMAGQDRSPRIRIAVAMALAAARDNENAVAIAESVLSAKDEWLRRQACELLSGFDFPMIEKIKLVQRLAAHESVDANKTALGMLNTQDFANAVSEATTICIELLKKADREIQEASVNTLAQLIKNSDREDEICKTVFQLEDGRLKRLFINGMANAGFLNLLSIKYALRDTSPLVRQTALEVVPAVGKKARPILPEIAVALDDNDHSVRMAAVRAVDSVDHSFDRSYSTWPPRPEQERRHIAAAKLVTGTGGTNTLALAEDVLASKGQNSALALAALSQHGERAVPILEKAIQNSDWPLVGKIFITVLEMATNTTGCLTLAKSSLENTNRTIQAGVDNALGFYKPKPELTPVLISLFEEGNDSAKTKVCRLFLKLGTNAIAAKPSLELALAELDLTNRSSRIRIEVALRRVQGIVSTNRQSGSVSNNAPAKRD